MKKKNYVIACLIIIILLGVLLFYKISANRRDEKNGQEKFRQAISELSTSEPQFDNPCLGTSVRRSYSYSELNTKTLDEIKELAKTDPGSC